MLNKISGLARTIYIAIAIIAAFVPLGQLNVPLVLLVLGLIAGLALDEDGDVVEDIVWRAASVLVLPIIGKALAMIPTIGEGLSKVAENLVFGLAGAVATAIALQLYKLAINGVTGMTADHKK